jgi:4'-phosphopantetheinyl transferase
VDLERHMPVPELEGVIAMLHPRERAALGALPPAERLCAFYRCWTRKEAVLKALGCGLSAGLSSISVDVSAGARPQVLDPGEHQAAAGLQIHDLPVGAGYWGAAATAPGVERISVMRWPHGSTDAEAAHGR